MERPEDLLPSAWNEHKSIDVSTEIEVPPGICTTNCLRVLNRAEHTSTDESRLSCAYMLKSKCYCYIPQYIAVIEPVGVRTNRRVLYLTLSRQI